MSALRTSCKFVSSGGFGRYPKFLSHREPVGPVLRLWTNRPLAREISSVHEIAKNSGSDNIKIKVDQTDWNDVELKPYIPELMDRNPSHLVIIEKPRDEWKDEHFGFSINFNWIGILGVGLLVIAFKALDDGSSVSASVPLDDDDVKKKDNEKPNKKPRSRRRIFNFIADVVAETSPGVVNILLKNNGVIMDFATRQPFLGNGSGFIVEEDGLILTNAHVVLGPKHSSIMVKLSDGRILSGHLEDYDEHYDIATIRIKAKNLPTIKMGDSSDVRIGEWVVAIGNPLSLENSATCGVVSSVERIASQLGVNNDVNYIQTDAAITFGNSGGPLVNLDSEVIGINCMKVASGISFALPINIIKQFLERVKQRKSVRAVPRRYVGVTLLTITEDIRTNLKLRGESINRSTGVLVWSVNIGSPAQVAGLLPGDVITGINGQTIKTAEEALKLLQDNDQLSLILDRGGNFFSCVILPLDVPV